MLDMRTGLHEKLDYEVQVEPTQRLKRGSGSTGIEVGVKAPPTLTESARLDEQAVIHEITGCPGKMVFIPRWFDDNLTIAPSIICWTCNTLCVSDLPETFLG